MMTVEEYASDMNKSIKEIMDLCNRLDISVNNADDMLSDDDIILLDNEIENNSSIEEENDEIVLFLRILFLLFISSIYNLYFI